MNREESYDVVERSRHWYVVTHTVVEHPLGAPAPTITIDEIRGYFSQTRAEEHAQGLASGTHNYLGPIRASFIVEYNEEEETPDGSS